MDAKEMDFPARLRSDGDSGTEMEVEWLDEPANGSHNSCVLSTFSESSQMGAECLEECISENEQSGGSDIEWLEESSDKDDEKFDACVSKPNCKVGDLVSDKLTTFSSIDTHLSENELILGMFAEVPEYYEEEENAELSAYLLDIDEKSKKNCFGDVPNQSENESLVISKCNDSDVENKCVATKSSDELVDIPLKNHSIANVIKSRCALEPINEGTTKNLPEKGKNIGPEVINMLSIDDSSTELCCKDEENKQSKLTCEINAKCKLQNIETKIMSSNECVDKCAETPEKIITGSIENIELQHNHESITPLDYSERCEIYKSEENISGTAESNKNTAGNTSSSDNIQVDVANNDLLKSNQLTIKSYETEDDPTEKVLSDEENSLQSDGPETSCGEIVQITVTSTSPASTKTDLTRNMKTNENDTQNCLSVVSPSTLGSSTFHIDEIEENTCVSLNSNDSVLLDNNGRKIDNEKETHVKIASTPWALIDSIGNDSLCAGTSEDLFDKSNELLNNGQEKGLNRSHFWPTTIGLDCKKYGSPEKDVSYYENEPLGITRNISPRKDELAPMSEPGLDLPIFYNIDPKENEPAEATAFVVGSRSSMGLNDERENPDIMKSTLRTITNLDCKKIEKECGETIKNTIVEENETFHPASCVSNIERHKPENEKIPILSIFSDPSCSEPNEATDVIDENDGGSLMGNANLTAHNYVDLKGTCTKKVENKRLYTVGKSNIKKIEVLTNSGYVENIPMNSKSEILPCVPQYLDKGNMFTDPDVICYEENELANTTCNPTLNRSFDLQENGKSVSKTCASYAVREENKDESIETISDMFVHEKELINIKCSTPNDAAGDFMADAKPVSESHCNAVCEESSRDFTETVKIMSAHENDTSNNIDCSAEHFLTKEQPSRTYFKHNTYEEASESTEAISDSRNERNESGSEESETIAKQTESFTRGSKSDISNGESESISRSENILETKQVVPICSNTDCEGIEGKCISSNDRDLMVLKNPVSAASSSVVCKHKETEFLSDINKKDSDIFSASSNTSIDKVGLENSDSGLQVSSSAKLKENEKHCVPVIRDVIGDQIDMLNDNNRTLSQEDLLQSVWPFSENLDCSKSPEKARAEIDKSYSSESNSTISALADENYKEDNDCGIKTVSDMKYEMSCVSELSFGDNAARENIPLNVLDGISEPIAKTDDNNKLEGQSDKSCETVSQEKEEDSRETVDTQETPSKCTGLANTDEDVNNGENGDHSGSSHRCVVQLKKMKCVVCNVRVCPECRCQYSSTLRAHLARGPKNQECTKCGIMLSSNCSYKAHLRLHSLEVPGVCPECGVIYSGNIKFLFNHFKSKCLHLYKLQFYECPMISCVETFQTRTSLFKHLVLHKMTAYKCKVCSTIIKMGKKKAIEHVIARHSAGATSTLGYWTTPVTMCGICGMPAGSSSSFLDHIWGHIDRVKPSKKYCCGCRKEFVKRENFLKHAHCFQNHWITAQFFAEGSSKTISKKSPKENKPQNDIITYGKAISVKSPKENKPQKDIKTYGKTASKSDDLSTNNNGEAQRKRSRILLSKNRSVNKSAQLRTCPFMYTTDMELINRSNNGEELKSMGCEISLQGHDSVGRSMMTIDLEYNCLPEDHQDYCATSETALAAAIELKKQQLQFGTPFVSVSGSDTDWIAQKARPSHSEILEYGNLQPKQPQPVQQSGIKCPLCVERFRYFIEFYNHSKLRHNYVVLDFESDSERQSAPSNKVANKPKKLTLLGSIPARKLIAVKDIFGRSLTQNKENLPLRVVSKSNGKVIELKKNSNSLLKVNPDSKTTAGTVGAVPAVEAAAPTIASTELTAVSADPLPSTKGREIQKKTEAQFWDESYARLQRAQRGEGVIDCIDLEEFSPKRSVKKPKRLLEIDQSEEIFDEETIVGHKSRPLNKRKRLPADYDTLDPDFDDEMPDTFKNDNSLEVACRKRTVKKPIRLLEELEKVEEVSFKKSCHSNQSGKRQCGSDSDSDGDDSISSSSSEKIFKAEVLSPTTSRRFSYLIDEIKTEIETSADSGSDNEGVSLQERLGSVSSKKRRKSSSSHSTSHQSDKHVDFSTGQLVADMKLLCVICNIRFFDENIFRDHLKGHQADKNTHQCMECGECFLVRSSLEMHIGFFHKIVKDEKVSRPSTPSTPTKDVEPLEENQCRICRKVFNSPSSHNQHFRTHGMAFLNKIGVGDPEDN